MSIRRLLVVPPGTAAATENKCESEEPEAFAIRNENQKHSSRAHTHNSSHDGDPEESPRPKAVVTDLLEKNSFLKSAVNTCHSERSEESRSLQLPGAEDSSLRSD